MKCLTKEQILKADDVAIEAVKVPEWGSGDVEACVFVRGLTGTQRDNFEGSRVSVTDGGQKKRKVRLNHENTRANLLAMSLCDERGTLLFTLDDVIDLGRKSALALDRCFDVAQRLSGMGEQNAEITLKNSEADQTGNSIFD